MNEDPTEKVVAMRSVFVVAWLMSVPACGGNGAGLLECDQNSNCDLASGGVCSAPGTGHRWCSYPDPSCAGGLRYSDVGVGDGVSGMCVDAPQDGGIDSGPVVDGGTSLSCAALPRTCGAAGNDDCCNSPAVIGGTYHRSYDVAGDSDSGDKNSPATVSSFRLDKYEVTVARFRAFVADGQGTQTRYPATGAGAHEKIQGSGWQAGWNSSLAFNTASLVAGLKCHPTYQTWTDAPGANESRPINCVTWYEAMAFCVWDGGYLPTEAEWNYAATGGDEQRAYPWSAPPASLAIDGAHASYALGTTDNPDCLGDGVSGCSLSDIVAVGSKPAGDGRWGQSDLGGNMAEWVLDVRLPYSVPCTDCALLSGAPNRMLRGGNFRNAAIFVRAGFRTNNVPTARFDILGFRCARSAP